MLENFDDIVMDEFPNSLPPVKSISHQENEEVKR
jgi:hypothetical protein